METYSIKFRNFSFPLIRTAGLIVFFCLMTWAVIASNYSTIRAVDHEIQRTFEHVHAIARLILENKLLAVEEELINLAGSDQLIQAVFNQDKSLAHQVLTQKPLSERFTDILFINLPQIPFWENNGQFNAKFQKLTLHEWQLIWTKARKPVLLLSIPLFSKSGRFLGSLSGGIILSQNNSILEYIQAQTQSRIAAFCLNSQIIQSVGDHLTQDIKTLSGVKYSGFDTGLQFTENMIFSTQKLEIRGKKISLCLLTGLENQNFDQFRRQYRLSGSMLICLIALVISFLCQHFCIIKRKKIECALMDKKARLRAIFDHAGMGIALIEPGGKCLQVNQKFCDILGYSSHEIQNMSIRDIRHPDDKNTNGVQRLLAGEIDKYTVDRQYRRKDKIWIWVSMTVSLVWEDEGKPGYFVALVEDISSRKIANKRLHMAKQVFENLQECVFIMDIQGIILEVNTAFSKTTGYEREEVIGKNVRHMLSEYQRPTFYREIWVHLQKSGKWTGEIWGLRKNGEMYPKWMSVSAIQDKKLQITHYVAIFSDVSAAKQAEEDLYRLANFDRLTKLANRTLFMDRLNRAMLSADENQRIVGLIHLDLDNFKLINETLGYLQGDQVLKSVSTRLLQSIKERDTVARLGSDEFGIVLSDMRKSRNAASVAIRLMDILSKPFDLEKQEIFLSCSIGISIYPFDSQKADMLVQNANIALSHAKATPGKSNYQFFSKDMNKKVSERLQLELALHGALDRNEFRVYYQPKIDSVSGKMISMEALIRWENPEKGIISPMKFIPLAEENGLIVPIGLWVLKTACTHTKAWQEAGFEPLRVSVNLSARQFNQPDLVECVIAILNETGLKAHYLELEITESLLMDDVTKTIEILYKLKKLGVFLSIDDFGTGYSSLSYLKRFPVDAIKIDQCFIFEVVSNPEDAAITSAIINMAKSLNLRVTAEGAETFNHVRFLQEKNCEEIQGYYFSRPLCHKDFANLLEKGSNFSEMMS